MSSSKLPGRRTTPSICVFNLTEGIGTLFYGHELHKLKYSRLLRLLRLFLPRTWLESLCEKQRIRVHTTHPAYSSQECPEGHTIETDNRLFSMSVAGMRMFHRREMMR